MHPWHHLKRVVKNMVADACERHWFRENSLYRHMALEAHQRSVAFAVQNLTHARRFMNRRDLLKFCVKEAAAHAAPDDMFAEFGIFKGESLSHLCALVPDKTVYGFDSFEGLPEDWGAVLHKDFFKLENLPEVPANARLIKGWFKDSLPPFLSKQPAVFAFIHIDCDLYSSTRDVLSAVVSRLKPGTIIVFDELINVVGWEHNEYKAWAECAEENHIRFSYIAFNSEQTLGAGTEVAVRIDAINR